MYWQAGCREARIKRDVGNFWKAMAMKLHGLRSRIEPAVRRILHLYWRFARGMTLGVRAVVLDRDNRVFLVKHSYVAGWHLPGGGVETGETFGESLRRELMDHVAVYVVRDFSQDRLPEANNEIIACGFFAAAALPADTTRGTRLRISEVLEGRAKTATWR
jgi:ADP-ribose pyrophosphatase YjhB (NUDIX family)